MLTVVFFLSSYLLCNTSIAVYRRLSTVVFLQLTDMFIALDTNQYSVIALHPDGTWCVQCTCDSLTDAQSASDAWNSHPIDGATYYVTLGCGLKLIHMYGTSLPIAA